MSKALRPICGCHVAACGLVVVALLGTVLAIAVAAQQDASVSCEEPVAALTGCSEGVVGDTVTNAEPERQPLSALCASVAAAVVGRSHSCGTAESRQHPTVPPRCSNNNERAEPLVEVLAASLL